MTVTAKRLISAKFAQGANNTEYTAPANTKAILDKLVACNTDSGSHTLSINVVASGDTVGAKNLFISALSLSAGATHDFTELKGLILEAGDYINIAADAANVVSIAASGREIT